jgi:hypothetical protein
METRFGDFAFQIVELLFGEASMASVELHADAVGRLIGEYSSKSPTSVRIVTLASLIQRLRSYVINLTAGHQVPNQESLCRNSPDLRKGEIGE